MKVDGACHCGKLTYEAEVDPENVIICHCSDCQNISDAPYRVSVVQVKAEDFDLHGTPKTYVKTADSGNRISLAFCGDCGSALYSTAVDFSRGLNLRLGAIKQRALLPPQSSRLLPVCDAVGDRRQRHFAKSRIRPHPSDRIIDHALIRRATLADAPGIARVHVASYRAAYRGLMLDEHLASFEEDGRRVAFVHLLSDGRYPIDVLKLDEVRGFRGYGAARDEDKSPRSCCELQALYLDRFVWRHGYGAVMTQRVLDYGPHALLLRGGAVRARRKRARAILLRSDGVCARRCKEDAVSRRLERNRNEVQGRPAWQQLTFAWSRW